MHKGGAILLTVLCLALPLHADPIPAHTDSLFSPYDFPSLGRVTVTPGQTITFHTGTASNAPYVDGAGLSMEPGSVGESKNGKVRLAVFSFSELVLESGSTVVVTGDMGLVLCSLNNIDVGTGISLAGMKGPAHNKGGAGGPGAEAGVSMVNTNSAPPGAERGHGGDGRVRHVLCRAAAAFHPAGAGDHRQLRPGFVLIPASCRADTPRLGDLMT